MFTRFQRVFGIALVVAASLVASGSVFAASTVYEWDGTSSIYSNDTHWTPGGGPPTNTDSAVFGTTGSYTVTFDRNERSDFLYVTNSNIVTFDLGGNTYTINAPSQTDRIVIGSNSTDNVSLIVENGTFDAQFNTARTELNLAMEGGQASLIVTNGGTFLANYFYANYAGSTGQVVVTGAGSSLYAETGFQGQSATEDMPLIVRDGAGAQVNNPYWDKQEVIGAALTNAGGNARIMWNSDGYLRVTDGGTVVMAAGENALAYHSYAGTAQVLVGDGSGPGTSLLDVAGSGSLQIGAGAHSSPATDFSIGSDGLVRVRGTSLVSLNQRTTATLTDGQMELTNGVRVLVNTRFTAGHDAAVLRGRGTLSVIGAGTQNFSLDNYGVIRPGDVSATPAIGTLTLNNGDLYQTNSALALSSRMYFEFDETSNDLLQLNNGLALVTAGTNTFALAPGAGIPLPGVKYGKGTYDLLVATNLTWSPAYDNMTNLLSGTYGLTYGLDYQYGIVQTGAEQFALRLAFVPEPSTIMLLLGGGLLLWRFRRN